MYWHTGHRVALSIAPKSLAEEMGAGGSKKVNPGLADTDKDGIISVEELDAMLQETGIDWPRKRKEKLLGALDDLRDAGRPARGHGVARQDGARVAALRLSF